MRRWQTMEKHPPHLPLQHQVVPLVGETTLKMILSATEYIVVVKKWLVLKRVDPFPIQVEMDHTMLQQWISLEKNQHHPIPHPSVNLPKKPADAPPVNPDQKVEVEKAPEKTEEVPATPKAPASPPANTEKPPAQETNPEKVVEQIPTTPAKNQ